MLPFEEKLIKNVQKLSFAPQELASSKYQQLNAWISQGDLAKFVNERTITLWKDWFEVRATLLKEKKVFSIKFLRFACSRIQMSKLSKTILKWQKASSC